MSALKTKQALYTHCSNFVDARLTSLKAVLSDIDESLKQETKSSAGDKHETGRAMIQLEQETSNRQLEEALMLSASLQSIDPKSTSVLVSPGSFVLTNKANYYISISAGKTSIDGVIYYCVSPASPIGKALLGKQTRDVANFNGNNINILEVI